MSYDIASLQQQFKGNLNLYNKWKEVTGKNWDYVTYSSMVKGEDIKALFQNMENTLEGNSLKGDQKDGNVLSWDRYFQQGNDIFTQTQDGQILHMNADNGSIEMGNDAMKALQSKMGIGDNTFDTFDFDKDKINFAKYTFQGLGDSKADKIVSQQAQDATHIYEELDLLKNPERLQEIADTYNHDHGDSLSSLKTLFGDETDITRDANGKLSSAVNYLNDTSMMVVQNGRSFAVKYKDGKITVEEITTTNASKYLNVDKNKTLMSLDYDVDNNDKIITNVTYKGEAGSTATTGKSTGSGDPHFSLNGQHIFDLQGVGGGSTGEYTLLQDNDVKWTTNFLTAQAGQDGATYMGSQHIELKTQNGKIVIDYNAQGSYTVKLNGELITDPSVYGVNVSKNGNALSVGYQDRLFNFNGADVDTNKINAGSTGILTQLNDLTDGQASADNLNQVMVNSGAAAISAPVKITQGSDVNQLAKDFVDTIKTWGTDYAAFIMKEASSDILNAANVDYSYNPANDNSRTTQQKAELCARIALSALSNNNISEDIKTKCVANWIEFSSQAMLADIQAKKGSSYASRFVDGNGYSRSQWNEYMGTVSFANKADIDKNSTEDIAMDIDKDNATDGFDLNHDGILQETEKVMKELDEFKSTKQTLSFLG